MSQFKAFEINQEITLNAAPERVWDALTVDIGQWWAYHVGEEGSTISLDARLGGRFEERWGNGDGSIWGEVIDLRKGERLRLKGSLGVTGAGINDYIYELEARGAGTILKLSHHGMGHRDPSTEKNYTEGWNDLLLRFLPAWLEKGKTWPEVKAEEG